VKIKKLNLVFRKNIGNGIFHNSRQDVYTLADALEKATKKIDELVDAVNRLKEYTTPESEASHEATKR